MADISKIKLPSGNVYDIKDATARAMISGATWSVTYEMDGYVYTISNITADHTIVVSPSGGTSINIRVKQNGTWITPSKVFVKQNGTWRQATKVLGKINGSWN